MGSPTQNSSQKMKTAIIFQLTFICLITAQDQSTTQSQGDCCPWKTVGDNTYYFIRKDPIAYHHDCKSDCIYKKYYNQTATTTYQPPDETEYCFKMGILPTQCFYDEDDIARGCTNPTAASGAFACLDHVMWQCINGSWKTLNSSC